AWIRAVRRVQVHVRAIAASAPEESVLRELAEEDPKDPTIDHNLRAALLGTVEARPVAEEAEDARAGAFLDLDRIDCLRGPGRRRGRPSPAGGPLARRRIRLRNGPGRENLPELLLRDDFVAGRQAADREALRRPEVVWRQEDELSRTERGNRREDLLRGPGMDACDDMPYAVQILFRHEPTQGPGARLAERLVVEVGHVLRCDDHADAVLARLPEQEGEELLRRRIPGMRRTQTRDLVDVDDEPQVAARAGRHPRDDVLAQGRDDELAFARVPQASRIHDVHGDAAARSLEHGFDIERRAGGEEEALRADGHRFRATDQRGPLPAREELRRVRRGIAFEEPHEARDVRRPRARLHGPLQGEEQDVFHAGPN